MRSVRAFPSSRRAPSGVASTRTRSRTSHRPIPTRLGEFLAERRRQGLRVNVNHLGEEVLGEADAARMLDQVPRASRAPRRQHHQREALVDRQPHRPRRLGRDARAALGKARAHLPNGAGAPRLRRLGRGASRSSSTSTWRRIAISSSRSRCSNACSRAPSSRGFRPASCCKPTSPIRIATRHGSSPGRASASRAAELRFACGWSRAQTS